MSMNTWNIKHDSGMKLGITRYAKFAKIEMSKNHFGRLDRCLIASVFKS